jgi:hypothetical protein
MNTRHIIVSAVAFAWFGACTVEVQQAELETESATDGDTELDEDRTAPVCAPSKQLERVDCNLGLTGSEPLGTCEAVLASVEPDGSIRVTARMYKKDGCDCEWTPPGKVGDATATCSDLDPGYGTPVGSGQLCEPVKLRPGNIVNITREGVGASYDEAEIAALVSCQAAAVERCIWSCAYAKDGGYMKQPKRPIDCCVPRDEPCADDECDPDEVDDSSDEPLPQPVPDPTPAA